MPHQPQKVFFALVFRQHFEPGLHGRELPRFPALITPVNLPPEYQPALKWCLAEVFRESYQIPPSPMISKFARRALNAIRLANVAVPTLTMPNAVRNRGRAYDYHSDI